MDPEIRRLLEENHALAKDTHRLVRSIRTHQLWSSFGRFFLWLIAIVLAAYFYVMFVKPLAAKYSAGNTPSPAAGFFSASSADIQKLLNSVKAGQ